MAAYYFFKIEVMDLMKNDCGCALKMMKRASAEKECK
jgi:hypothetical protein